MTDFRTIVKIEESKNKIDYTSKCMFIGSCFTENIGSYFSKNKFQSIINPFGIIYNPASVKNSLDTLLNANCFNEDDLRFFNEKWISLNHHGDFSNSNKVVCLNSINSSIKESSVFLKSADYLFITFGTSWIYELNETGKVVANCHKIPSKEFSRRRLSIDEIVSDYIWLIKRLKEFNPNLKIIFTVSPVRHWKDGAHGNQLSKSTLLLAIEQIIEVFADVSYFPSYEIVLDELRDYRFFNEDMLHPNGVATKYIWQRLIETFMRTETIDLMAEIEKISNAFNHRPINSHTESHQKFLNKFQQLATNLMKNNPEIDLKSELDYFLNQQA